MKKIRILHCPEIRCPDVLLLVFQDFCGAFTRKGIDVQFIDSISKITDDSVVFMGNFFNVDHPAALLANQSLQAVYIGWYWHKQDISGLPYFIHVYENITETDIEERYATTMEFMKQRINTCPFLLRANEDPINIGTYKRCPMRDYCFMGGRMFAHLVPHKPWTGIYHGSHSCDDYFPYETRREVYLTSTFALGFQTSDNCAIGHVSQRIFEGLAYGCVVFSNSIHASKQTEGIVEYFEGRLQLEEKMQYFLDHPEEIKDRQQRGYDFVKRKGTNEYSLSVLHKTIKNVYDIDILQ